MRTQRVVVVALLAVSAVVTVGCGGDGGKTDSEEPAPKRVSALPPGDMTLKAFILQKPSEPTAVQVQCKMDTYYNFAFSRCAETHYSFTLESESPYTIAHGYAPKSSEDGRRLYELLKNGDK